MTGNRSLDEFAGPAGEADEDRPAGGDDGPTAGPGPDAVETATDAAGSVPDAGQDPESGEDGETPGDVERLDDDPGAGDAGDASDDDPEAVAIEPVAPTYAWSPDGGECSACGAIAEERWRDGDDLVCLDCKEW